MCEQEPPSLGVYLKKTSARGAAQRANPTGDSQDLGEKGSEWFLLGRHRLHIPPQTPQRGITEPIGTTQGERMRFEAILVLVLRAVSKDRPLA